MIKPFIIGFIGLAGVLVLEVLPDTKHDWRIIMPSTGSDAAVMTALMPSGARLLSKQSESVYIVRPTGKTRSQDFYDLGARLVLNNAISSACSTPKARTYKMRE